MPASQARARPALYSVITAALAAIGGVATALLADADLSVLLIAAIGLALLVPIAFRVASGRWDIFEPLNVFAIAWGMMFVVRPIAMIANGEWGYYFAPAVDLHATFDKMLLLALIGAICFGIGYHLPIAKRLAARAPKPPVGYEPSTVVTICLAATAFALFLFALFIIEGGGLKAIELISSGRSDALQQLLKDSNKYFVFGPVLLVGTTLVTFALAIDLRDRALGVLAGLSVVLVWVIWNSFGSRIVLFPVFAGMAICWYLQHNRRPKLITVAVAALATLFLSTVIAAERISTIRATQSKPQIALETLKDPGSMFDTVTIGPDNTMAPGLAAAMAIAPAQFPRTYGWSMLQDSLVRAVPRATWSGKPRPPRERLIAKMTPAGYQARTANPEFSNLLVPYLDWGLFGGLFLIVYGVIGRAFYEWFLLHRSSLAARLVFALSLPLMFTVSRDSFIDAFALAALMAVPIWVAFVLGRRWQPGPRTAAAEAS